MNNGIDRLACQRRTSGNRQRPVHSRSQRANVNSGEDTALQQAGVARGAPIELARHHIRLSPRYDECAPRLTDAVSSTVRRAARRDIGRRSTCHDTVRLTIRTSEPRVRDCSVALLFDVIMDTPPNEPCGDVVTFLARRMLSGGGGMSRRDIYHATLAPRDIRANTMYFGDDTCKQCN